MLISLSDFIYFQNCLKAMGKTFHPECFVCAYCGKIFANSPFYLEDGLPYCEEGKNHWFSNITYLSFKLSLIFGKYK